MLIWLGKQRLGQKEHEEKVQTSPNDALLTVAQDALKENASLKGMIQTLQEQLNALIAKANPILSASDQAL